MCNRTGNINQNGKGNWSWQSDKNPSSHTGPDHWKPYTKAQNEIIEQAYEDGKDEVGVGDYVVDFDEGHQYKLSDNTKTRPIKRE